MDHVNLTFQPFRSADDIACISMACLAILLNRDGCNRSSPGMLA
jgi:hypothetical protein